MSQRGSLNLLLKGWIELRWKLEEEARLRLEDCLQVGRLHLGEREDSRGREGEEKRKRKGSETNRNKVLKKQRMGSEVWMVDYSQGSMGVAFLEIVYGGGGRENSEGREILKYKCSEVGS